jgi:hypothetical protein
LARDATDTPSTLMAAEQQVVDVSILSMTISLKKTLFNPQR